MSKQNQLKEAIYNLIENNKDVLTDGIIQQGVQREIKEILKSSLTSSKQVYSIAIRIESVYHSQLNTANARFGRIQSKYAVELHVLDYAIPQVSDREQMPYETAHYDFDLLVDRLAALLYSVNSFVYDKTKFILDGDVAITNRADWYDTGDKVFPALYSIVRFSVVDRCEDFVQ